ncbi:hypothetical protein NDU88_001403 [Pleurodeles waltl]|uniref:Uncharacterized protein n=1 Tax=Pleurodeles waltl TaxID=8319 RepID=A0AAV7WI84_PLEWA|nr:hypothetical protein NDU88_001403 [Pleurodeles waltl]
MQATSCATGCNGRSSAAGRCLAAGQDGRHQVRLRWASGQNSIFLFILWTSAAGAGLAVPTRGPRRQVEHCGAAESGAVVGLREAGPGAALCPSRAFAARGGEGLRPLPATVHGRERECVREPVGRPVGPRLSQIWCLGRRVPFGASVAPRWRRRSFLGLGPFGYTGSLLGRTAPGLR